MKRAALGLAIFLSLGLIISGAWLLFFKDKTRWQTFNDPKTGLSISYPANSSVSALSQQDIADHIIFRATESQNNKSSYLITARYETGIREIASLTKQEPIKMLANNANAALPNRFPNFSKISEDFKRAGDLPVWELYFSYQKPSEDKVQQRFLVVMKSDGDTAVYIAIQSKQSDWPKLSAQYFNRLYNTISFSK